MYKRQVFLGRGTTGGTDLVASLIHRYVKHISIARIMQVIDGIIVVIGAVVFGPTKAMYAIVAIYIVGKVTDGLQEGLNYAKAVYIITDHQEEVSRRIDVYKRQEEKLVRSLTTNMYW